jgi:hypothetical protein
LLQGKTIGTLLSLALIGMVGGGMGVVGGGMAVAMASVANGGFQFFPSSCSMSCTSLYRFLGTLKLLGG